MSTLDDLAKELADLTSSLAAERLGDSGFARSLWKAVKDYLPAAINHGGGRPPTETASVLEGGGKWVARLLIFDWRNELVADSQPNEDLEAPPRELLPTLRHVAEWAREQAQAYHEGTPITGLDDGEIKRRILTARVKLSRANGADVWWQLPFKVGTEQWTVNARIGKATTEQAEAGPKPEPVWRTATEDPAAPQEGPTAAALAEAAFSRPTG